MMNLCTNAYQAMFENGGILEINLQAVQVDKQLALQHPNLHVGQYVRLTVTDTGTGMDPYLLERIFEPYFTTKPLSEGTGLGLAVIHGIVMNLGGAITVQSRVGIGTSFNVFLPQLNVVAESESVGRELIPRGDERVLFVDDEEPLTVIGKKLLERLGYTVTVRTSSVEAFHAFQANPEKFDIVITDQMMPNMTGLQLSKKIKEIRKDIPVVLITGFSETLNMDAINDSGINEFALKPMTTNDIAQLIRKALETKEFSK
ncbi:MAG: response regulator [Proteobacteria bacterium]|nr:response regulator [Pseudomonadota bacterium]MBU1708498.1 response regulator [Pseudomonadota bacterium]